MNGTLAELAANAPIAAAVVVGFLLHARTSRNGSGNSQRILTENTEAVRGLAQSLDRNTRVVEEQGRTLLRFAERTMEKED